MFKHNFRLAITGSFGAKDIGDEAMLTEDLDYVLNVVGLERKQVFLFGWNRDYMSRYHSHPIENCFPSANLELACAERGMLDPRIAGKLIKRRKQIKKIRTIVQSCDALLVTGGGTINTRERKGASVRRMYNMVRAFSQQGTPIFLSGQTIGPLALYPEHDRMAKYVVEAVDCLTVRDAHYSRRYMDLINAKPKELIETFDDAYTLPHEEVQLPSDVETFLQDGNCFAVNVTDYTSDTPEKRAYMTKVCEAVMRQYGVNVVLASHSPSDLTSLWMIRDSIDNDLKSRVIVPDTREWHDKKLKKMIASCKIAIGGRYHFIVFAGTSNTPFVGMAGNHYSYIKQDGFARMVGQERYILTEHQTWDLDLLLERVAERVGQQLNLSDRFERPSVSMRRFSEWLNEKFSLTDNNQP